MPHGDGVGEILVGVVLQNLPDGRIQRESTGCNLLKHCRAGEHLSCRGKVEAGEGGDRCLLFFVDFSIGLFENDVAVARHQYNTRELICLFKSKCKASQLCQSNVIRVGCRLLHRDQWTDCSHGNGEHAGLR